MKGLRVKQLAEALNKDTSDILSVCMILKFRATSKISLLTFKECKAITDFFDKND